jgi:predicted transcriptional regulator
MDSAAEKKNGGGNGKRKSLYGFEMSERRPDKRRKDEDRKTYNVKQLWQHTHEILRLALLGMKAGHIAKLLGLHRSTVSATLNSDLGMKKLSAMRRERDQGTIDIVEEVQKLFPQAVETYKKIMEDEKAAPGLKKEVADTLIMDIGGHRAPKQVEGKFVSAHLTSPEIEAIKKRGRLAAKSQGKLVEDTEVPDAEVVPDGVPVHTG